MLHCAYGSLCAAYTLVISLLSYPYSFYTWPKYHDNSMPIVCVLFLLLSSTFVSAAHASNAQRCRRFKKPIQVLCVMVDRWVGSCDPRGIADMQWVSRLLAAVGLGVRVCSPVALGEGMSDHCRLVLRTVKEKMCLGNKREWLLVKRSTSLVTSAFTKKIQLNFNN